MAADRDRIWRAILEVGTCMMVTRDGDMLRARPMQALAEPDENAVWFLSDSETHKDAEIRRDPRVCLAFADVEDDLYVSLSGTLEVIEDQEKIAALLADDDEADEEEVEDAQELIALRFTPEIGEIWDGWSVGADEDEGTDAEEPDSAAGKIDFGKGRGNGDA